MPLRKHIHINGGEILIWEISEDLNTLKQLIPTITKKTQFLKLKNERRQREWLAVRMLLKQINCEAEQISYEESGKPIINHHKYSHISISHSDRFAGIMVHQQDHVGIDIENINRDFNRVAKKYLSEKELTLSETIDNGKALFWCIKEAAYKISGSEGINFIDQIQIEKESTSAFNVKIKLKQNLAFQVHYFIIDDQIITYLTPEKRNNV